MAATILAPGQRVLALEDPVEFNLIFNQSDLSGIDPWNVAELLLFEDLFKLPPSALGIPLCFQSEEGRCHEGQDHQSHYDHLVDIPEVVIELEVDMHHIYSCPEVLDFEFRFVKIKFNFDYKRLWSRRISWCGRSGKHATTK